jgi:hypothetical protein
MRKRKLLPKKECSKCNKPLEENRYGKCRYCLSCHNEHMRLTRPKHSQLSPLQKMKANCRSYLNVYIKRGKIIKQPCCICGNPKAEAHHEDYSKPLDVIWYCREHHLKIHS